MTTVLKKGMKSKDADKLLTQLKALKGIDTKKYCGVITLHEDPINFQKQMRDEWK